VGASASSEPQTTSESASTCAHFFGDDIGERPAHAGQDHQHEAEQGGLALEVERDQAHAAQGDQRAGQLDQLGRSPSSSTASPMVKKACSWITSEARPAGKPRAMPQNRSVNCSANWNMP
jgi:hypothetical protein